MKTKKYLALALGIAACTYMTTDGFAQSVPNLINYQGRLTDQTGAPLPAGSYAIQFRLWDSATSSTNLIWAQQQTVAVQTSGLFNVILGSPGSTNVPGLSPAVNDLSFAFSQNNRFLGITLVSSNSSPIPAPSEIRPRQQILSSPFSLRSGNGVPAGTLLPFAGGAPPPGFMLCDGHAVNSQQFPELFAAIGTAWGIGDGGTNDFTLPDLRGRVAIGLDNMGGSAAGRVSSPPASQLAGTGGVDQHTLSLDELPAHTHTYWDIMWCEHSGFDPGVSEVAVPNNFGANGGDNDNVGFQMQRTTDPAGNSSNPAFGTMPPFASVNYIIKY